MVNAFPEKILDEEKYFSMLQQKTILVVEDNPDIGEMLTEVLRTETPCQIQWATNGRQALEIARSGTLDLLLLNYQLPDMNGIELSDQLKARDGFSPIPTILMSATLPMEEIEKRLLFSLTKPFELDEVLQLVDRLLIEGVHQKHLEESDLKKSP